MSHSANAKPHPVDGDCYTTYSEFRQENADFIAFAWSAFLWPAMTARAQNNSKRYKSHNTLALMAEKRFHYRSFVRSGANLMR